jgi:hypothetical protein
MTKAKSAAKLFRDWFVMWLVLHGLHWLLTRYFGAVLPPAYSPATWRGDGIDALCVTAFMRLQDWVHKIVEKRQGIVGTHPAASGDPPEAGR